MRRLFNAHIQLIYKDEHGEATVNSLIAERTELWWTPNRPSQAGLWESKIYLGEAFFNEIIRHPVPLDMNTLKALKRCALGLDLYLWLTYRTFALTRPLQITWRQLYSQFGTWSRTKPAINSNRSKLPAQHVLRELKKIKLAWPGTELCDGSGRVDPLSLDARDPTGRAASDHRQLGS